jgi:hypothetical protein
MRKTFLILVVLLILPAAVFADLGVGGAAFFKSPVLLGQPIDAVNLNVNQFSFGGDLRLKLGWFQAEALLLYSAGEVSSVNTYVDAGVALDVAIVRLSLGAGPNFAYIFGSSVSQIGLNAKVGADVLFGPISVGLSYIMALNINGSGFDVSTSSGLLGVNVLFWM